MSSPRERRHNWAYLTRNTVYYTRQGRCVAVRDRTSGRWVEDHAAIRAELYGSMAINDNSEVLRPRFLDVQVGEQLCFVREGRNTLVTSRLEEVRRPTLDTIREHFPVDLPAVA